MEISILKTIVLVIASAFLGIISNVLSNIIQPHLERRKRLIISSFVALLGFVILLSLPVEKPNVISKPDLIYSWQKQNPGSLRIDLENKGTENATNITIEIAPRFSDPEKYETIALLDIKFIPPKEYEISTQWRFRLIKLKDPIYKQEKVSLFISSDIPEVEYDYLWIRVTSDEGEATKINGNE